MRKKVFTYSIIIFLSIIISGCVKQEQKSKALSAQDILGNPNYQAMSFGGFRGLTLDQTPTVEDLKEDMKVLNAMGIKLIRTYKTQKTKQVKFLLQAINELKNEDPSFEMYIMLGVWIECKGAFTPNPDNNVEDVEENTAEIVAAIEFANRYPDIVKIIAVGNEAMVRWATSYFVQPAVILKWVNYLIQKRNNEQLPKDIWITSSDNFASWGGGDSSYHTEDLVSLANAVDYISIHTYPFHDTHYNPSFWIYENTTSLDTNQIVDRLMNNSIQYAKDQYNSVDSYMKSIGVNKPIHIGETGWSSLTNQLYGPEGSRAADEYKLKLFYDGMRKWTDSDHISCFYFEAFDEPWKGSPNPFDSEKHFGLININSEAKYPLWDMVDQGVFEGIIRNGKPITKTFNGNKDDLLKTVLLPYSNAVLDN